MIVSIYLSIVLLSLVALHIAFRSTKFAKFINKIPGPSPLPFIGNGLMFHVSPEKLWEVLFQLMDDYYPIARAWIFHIGVVITGNPDDMRKILSCKKNIEKCERLVYNGVRAIDNDGLFVSRGEKWRQRRKLVTPALVPSMLKVYVQIMNEHAEQLIMDIKQNEPGREIDLVPICKKTALGIICEAAMGINPRSSGVKEEEQFRYNFDEIIEVIFYRATRPYIQDWMMKFLSVGRKLERAIPSFRKFSEMMIKKRREYHKRYPNLQNIVDEIDDPETTTNQRKRPAVVDLLLNAEAKDLIDERGITEEIESLISGGYDTSGIAMTFALMLLAENKTVQDLARAEVTQMLERTGGKLEMTDVNSLNYLDCCIKETLRLYPSGPILGRHITEKIELSNYEIPIGTELAMHVFHLHRNPNHWPDPEKFDPDRFLPENTKGRHPFAYLPFSAGPRGCPGYKFATLELKVAVAHILYNFYIEPVDFLADLKFKMNTSLMPKDPCRVKLICINRKSAS